MTEKDNFQKMKTIKQFAPRKKVGNIDPYKYGSKDIQTTEVILMAERELHIKEKHPDAYNIIMKNLKNIVENPDATFAEIDKNDTVWAVKQIDTQHARVVLKISRSTNILGYKNSVITGQLISKKRIEKALKKNRIILIYKSDK